MASSITINNLDNGQEIALPYTVDGTATALEPAANVVIIAWNIDDGELIDTNSTSASSINFEAIIANLAPETVHLFTVYVWDDQGDLTIESRTFTVVP
jgi:hypothetical protein